MCPDAKNMGMVGKLSVLETRTVSSLTRKTHVNLQAGKNRELVLNPVNTCNWQLKNASKTGSDGSVFTRSLVLCPLAATSGLSGTGSLGLGSGRTKSGTFGTRFFQTWNSEADRGTITEIIQHRLQHVATNRCLDCFDLCRFLHLERTQMTRICPPYSLPVHLPCLSSFLGPSLSLIMSKQVTSCNVVCSYVDFKNVTSPSVKMSCICMSTTLLGLEVRSALLSANLALGTPTVLELLFQPRGSFKLTLRTLFLQESGPKPAAYWDVCCASSTPVVVDSIRKSSEICFEVGSNRFATGCQRLGF